jgi:uncharacterized protein YajQ (UPF0234 family)
LELLKNIETKSLSVRDAEEWVKKWKQRNEQNNSSISPSTTALIEKLSKKGMALKLRQKKRGGQVILDYKNEADLQALLQKL